MKVLIDRNSGNDPRKVVDAIVGDQGYPFVVSLTHSNILPVVLPSSGLNTVLEPNKAYDVKVKSFHQAWHMVTDLSEYAARTENNAANYAEVTTAQVSAPLPDTTAVVVVPTPDATELDKGKTKEKVK